MNTLLYKGALRVLFAGVVFGVDSGFIEVKFFAAGIGEIKSVNLITDEQAFLIEFTRKASFRSPCL